MAVEIMEFSAAILICAVTEKSGVKEKKELVIAIIPNAVVQERKQKESQEKAEEKQESRIEAVTFRKEALPHGRIIPLCPEETGINVIAMRDKVICENWI